MSAVTSLKVIQSRWIAEAVNRLASQEPIREGVRESLDSFYHGLIQAIESGDARILDPILHVWVAARMRTDLDSNNTSIVPVLDEILDGVP